MPYGSLVPRPSIKPIPTVVTVQSLNHWTTREVSLPSILAINIESGFVTQSSYVKRASPDVSQPCWDLESLTSSSHWGRVCGLRGQERWQISKSFNGNSTVCVSCTWHKRNGNQICGKGAMGIPANRANVGVCLSLSPIYRIFLKVIYSHLVKKSNRKCV